MLMFEQVVVIPASQIHEKTVEVTLCRPQISKAWSYWLRVPLVPHILKDINFRPTTSRAWSRWAPSATVPVLGARFFFFLLSFSSARQRLSFALGKEPRCQFTSSHCKFFMVEM